MGQIFPRWTNRIPLIIALSITVLVLGGVGFIWYYFSPYYTDVGYRPIQPIEYSHKMHAGDLGLDCRYCHTGVEVSAVAGVPPTQTCMNCHKLVKADSEKLYKLRESWNAGIPIEWVRVHKIPDYAYFNHSSHLRVGVGCKSCHGRIDNMEVVMQSEPLSMSWCLDCHRDPTQHLRPISEVTDMKWEPRADQDEFARSQIEKLNIKPPVDCTGCHR